eukprot:NODE_5731_length_491_cov_172.176471_g4284_i0.p1 GENE.NODE_5731_length_491_cov_172.176471_g4284_i0~~NODE_5731_length_491_cov_172.176471_g4284_i0.p1  ORF type:complete len:123 (-),score=46.75 NODE_5731_length_491_cov_172.176471_g4284_i0:121-468(-)
MGSLSNFFMCGLPGGLDYCLLVAVKHGWIERVTEKRLNRHFNLLIRMPGMMLVTYILLLNFYLGRVYCTQVPLAHVAMIAGCLLHLLNSIYYCDKVVGNYHVEIKSDQAGGKKAN